MHDEFSQKFYRKKFTDDRQTLCHRKRRNTAPTGDRTGKESAAGKAHINYHNPLINLFIHRVSCPTLRIDTKIQLGQIY